MKSFSAFLVSLALIAAQNVRAEGGCPAGMIPYSATPAAGSAASMATCGPIPSSQANTPRWASRWGAVATGSDGEYGIVSDEPSERSAKKEAVKACFDRGGSNCEAKFTFRDQCAAVIGSKNGGSTVQSAETIEQAQGLGLDACRKKGANDCWVFYTGCSLPVKVN